MKASNYGTALFEMLFSPVALLQNLIWIVNQLPFHRKEQHLHTDNSLLRFNTHAASSESVCGGRIKPFHEKWESKDSPPSFSSTLLSSAHPRNILVPRDARVRESEREKVPVRWRLAGPIATKTLTLKQLLFYRVHPHITDIMLIMIQGFSGDREERALRLLGERCTWPRKPAWNLEARSR